MIRLIVFFLLILESVSANEIRWDFPLPRTHTGILLGNGNQGLMIWGQNNQLNITIAQAGFWNHREVQKFKPKATYKIVNELVMTQQYDSLKELFKKSVNGSPYQIGGGRLEFILLPGYELKYALLDPYSAIIKVFVHDVKGKAYVIEIYQDINSNIAVINTPAKNMLAKVNIVASYEHEPVKKQLVIDNVKPSNYFSIQEKKIFGFEQALPDDPSLTMAYKQLGNKYYASTSIGYFSKDTVISMLEQVIESNIIENNKIWWSAFWKDITKIAIPDRNLTELYIYNQYKLACSTTPHGKPCSLQGPFMEEYQLPKWSNDYHFNINVQMIYWPVFALGKQDHLKPLWNMLKEWYPDLKANGELFYGVKDAMMLPHATDDRGNVIGQFWTGIIDNACLAWNAEMAFKHYSYSGDTSILKEVALPMLIGSFESYFSMLKKREINASGYQYYMPITVSPEFKGARNDAWGVNASFQLAACHMVINRLIETAKIFNDTIDKRWLDVQKYLPMYTEFYGSSSKEYPEHKKRRIGLWEEMDLIESHRHHSHLAGIYPFRTLDLNDDSLKPILNNSLKHWSLMGAGNWTGWCIPWAATIQARMGNSDAALAWLNYWQFCFLNVGRGTLHNADFNGVASYSAYHYDKEFMKPSGEIMQLDAGFGFLDAMHNLFVQENKNSVTILPNIPRDWHTCSIENIWVEGGFRLSIYVENRKIVKTTVFSSRNNELTLNTSMKGFIKLNNQKVDSPTVILKMKANENFIITTEN